MKIVAINGSPRKGGNIAQCLDAMAKEFEREGIELEVVQPGGKSTSLHGMLSLSG